MVEYPCVVLSFGNPAQDLLKSFSVCPLYRRGGMRDFSNGCLVVVVFSVVSLATIVRCPDSTTWGFAAWACSVSVCAV
jgi:hypothetical protein